MPVSAVIVQNPASPEEAAERIAAKALAKAEAEAAPTHPDACTVCGVHTNGVNRCESCGKPYCNASHGRKALAACCGSAGA